MTQIIATIGPASAHVQTVQSYIDAGMAVARLNAAHPEGIEENIRLLRDHNVPILLDLPGPKIRTIHANITFHEGDHIVIGPQGIRIDYPNLWQYLKQGDSVSIADGQFAFQILRIEEENIHCLAQNNGTITGNKGVNVPGVALSDDHLITDQDKAILQYAPDVDWIGVSFATSRQHINAIRALCSDNKIVAKIETQEGLRHLDEILDVSDLVMVARGDLAIETQPERIALLQKDIIQHAKAKHVPAIVATQMMYSMLYQPYPTKAEIADVTNAVLDGASYGMLSEETAIGPYGAEAIDWMRRIMEATKPARG